MGAASSINEIRFVGTQPTSMLASSVVQAVCESTLIMHVG